MYSSNNWWYDATGTAIITQHTTSYMYSSNNWWYDYKGANQTNAMNRSYMYSSNNWWYDLGMKGVIVYDFPKSYMYSSNNWWYDLLLLIDIKRCLCHTCTVVTIGGMI